MNKIVIVIYLTVLAFILAVFVYDWTGRLVQDSLINMFFVLITGELATLGEIKITKTVKGTGTEAEPPPEGDMDSENYSATNSGETL